MSTTSLLTIGFLIIVVQICVHAIPYQSKLNNACSKTGCQPPDCKCATVEPPKKMSESPQLVMVTFDDAVTISNFPTYRDLLFDRVHKSGCPIQATFFVSHEYTNYQLVHELFRRGHEIAVHSIRYAIFLRIAINCEFKPCHRYGLMEKW